MSIPLPSPFTLFFLWVISFDPDERTLALVMALGAMALFPYLVLIITYKCSRSRVYSHYESATIESKQNLPAVKEREGGDDSAWASEYSLSIDRYDSLRLCGISDAHP